MPTSPILRARRILAVALAGGGAATAGIAFALTSAGAAAGPDSVVTSDRTEVRSGAESAGSTVDEQQGGDAIDSEGGSFGQRTGDEERLDSVLPEDSSAVSPQGGGAGGDGFSQAQPPQQAPGVGGGHSSSRGS